MIPKHWRAGASPPALLELALAPLAATFGQGVRWRNRYFDRGHGVRRAPLPVVAVGGLTVGGGGKTPAVQGLAALLTELGRTVAVASRGYGARPGREPLRVDRAATWSVSGDEPLLLARTLPGARVYVHPERWRSAELARAEGADVLLLDDGFQHRRLHRDLDLVALDAREPVGNGRLLPAGPLREPLSALARAAVVWLSRSDQASPGALQRTRELVQRHAPAATLVETVVAPVGLWALGGGAPGSPEELAGVRVQAWAGIALPEVFVRTLEDLGARVVGRTLFPDHHPYGSADLERVATEARQQGADLVVTTTKDAVRLDGRWPVRDLPVRALDVRPAIRTGAAQLRARLAAVLER